VRTLQCVSFMISFLIAISTYGSVYHNEEYGLETPIEAGAAACLPDDEPSNHGITIILNGSVADCSDVSKQPYVSVFAEYNVFFDTNPRQALRRLCSGGQGVLLPSPENIKVPDRAAALGECDLANDWVDIYWVTQSGTMPGNKIGDPPLPRVTISVSLHTKRARLRRDLREFERQIDVLRITPTD